MEAAPGAALDVLSRFRAEFYECLYSRADALFELTDAVLCKDGPVRPLVDLSLQAEHRRGHGALYQALNTGWVEPARLQAMLASLLVPRAVAREHGIQYGEVHDGSDCGWTSHSGPDEAARTLRTVEDAARWPIAHPGCTRVFGLASGTG